MKIKYLFGLIFIIGILILSGCEQNQISEKVEKITLASRNIKIDKVEWSGNNCDYYNNIIPVGEPPEAYTSSANVYLYFEGTHIPESYYECELYLDSSIQNENFKEMHFSALTSNYEAPSILVASVYENHDIKLCCNIVKSTITGYSDLSDEVCVNYHLSKKCIK